MRHFFGKIIVGVAILFASSVFAQTFSARQAIPNIYTLRNTTVTLSTQLNVTCYYSGLSQCAGGGNFDAGSPGCTNDDGILFVYNSHAGQCYQRRTFDINGVVDSRECGVVGDGFPAGGSMPDGSAHPDDGALLQACLTAASNVGVPVVNTGGGVILDNTTLIVVPLNVGLTCGGGPGSGGNQNDFRITSDGVSLNISNALVVAPQMLVNPDIQDAYKIYAAIVLKNGNSALRGCLVEVSDKDKNGNLIDSYAPSVWFPQCNSQSYPCTPLTPSTSPADIRSALLEANAFYRNGYDCDRLGTDANHPASCTIGVLVGYPGEDDQHNLKFSGGAGARIRDVTVLGFGTCVRSEARDLTVEHCRFDCATAFDLKTPDVPFISNVRNGPLLTAPQG
jgi:hypothetical protein